MMIMRFYLNVVCTFSLKFQPKLLHMVAILRNKNIELLKTIV